jgi:hypothetical protein
MKMTPQQKVDALEEYIKANHKYFDQAGNNLGLWLDKKTNVMWMDVSTVVSDRKSASRMAAEANQKAMWDIANNREINTGGSGE